MDRGWEAWGWVDALASWVESAGVTIKRDKLSDLFIIFKKAKKMRESSKKQATAAVTPQSHFYFTTTFHHYK